MTDILDKIDAALEEVEEQLLQELNSLRETATQNHYHEIDRGIRQALSDVVEEIYHSLQHSGDKSNLQLLTERHEVLYARIGVLRQLLGTNIPAFLLSEAHEGLEARRRTLERRVIERRRNEFAAAQATSSPKSGKFLAGLKGLFNHKPSQQETERNRINVTPQEEVQLEPEQDYLDNGIYSASRELAILASLIRGGSLDRPPTEDPGKGRAVFTARDLSTRLPPVTKRVAISKEPIPEPRPAKKDKGDIAQTPEEIKRKLEARRHQAAGGKATFASRDIAHASPREAPVEKSASTREESPRDGKAVFAARDIEPAVPREFYGRKRPQEDEAESAEEEDKPRTGRAVFEARDLSSTPFTKKDKD